MKKSLVDYVVRRIILFIILVIISTSIIFILPRLSPDTGPVEQAIGRVMSQGQYIDPQAVEQLRENLEIAYGLKGNIFQQYFTFWGNFLKGDLGPSFAYFPTPVTELIFHSLPWTIGLLGITTILSWILGNWLGGIVGNNRNKKWARTVEVIINGFRPIPHYILALVLLILFSHVFPIFPSGGAYPPGIIPNFSWSFILEVIKHAFLPALSLFILGIGGWFQGMRTLVSHIVQEDYVTYAKLTAIKKNEIFRGYILRNAMLPQVTGLALQIGMLFSGTLIVEIVFNYPGIGFLAYQAILRSDYNLIMGVTIFSILAVALGTLIIDLIYPLLDPRISYEK